MKLASIFEIVYKNQSPIGLVNVVNGKIGYIAVEVTKC